MADKTGDGLRMTDRWWRWMDTQPGAAWTRKGENGRGRSGRRKLALRAMREVDETAA